MRALVFACVVACGARAELDVPIAPSGNHAVAFAELGDDVFLAGVNATPASGFSWDFWFNAAKLPSSSAVDLHSGATLLVAADSAGCEDIYVGFGSPFSAANRLAFVVDGAGGCAARDTSPMDFAPPGGFAADRWYFVGVSHDYATGESRLYVDGVLVASRTALVAPMPRVLPATLGRWWDRVDVQYAYNEFVGVIDELHVYARALSDAEMASEHACDTPAPGLVAGYHFDEGAGESAANFVQSGAAVLEQNAKWAPGFVCGM